MLLKIQVKEQRNENDLKKERENIDIRKNKRNSNFNLFFSKIRKQK